MGCGRKPALAMIIILLTILLTKYFLERPVYGVISLDFVN
jgi:hypothetical protein